jgi:hypothetical protein
VPYLVDREFRRNALEAELVNPDNGYSRLRLSSYGLGGGWDLLDEYNPRREPVIGNADGPLSSAAMPLSLAVDPEDDAALRALGEDAFFHYPAQLVPAAAWALANGAADYGLWHDSARGIGGLQRVELDGGGVGLAVTCSTCHATIRGGTLVPGLANERLDLGQLFVDAGAIASADIPAVAAWGRGRLDVTTTAGVEPVRIPDLRKTASQTYLQADAAVVNRDLPSLAIRIETLIIVSHQQAVRPPRIVALALASYLTSLAESLPAPPDATAPGAGVFAAHCAGCHAPPEMTGAPVSLDAIGTDPTLGRSAERGTGTYQVPSLRGVAARRLLFHDGAVDSLDTLLDPARVDPGFTGGARVGAVPGHLFGLDLDPSDRADLLGYLEAL